MASNEKNLTTKSENSCAVMATTNNTSASPESYTPGTVGHLVVATNSKYSSAERSVARRKILDEDEYNQRIEAIVEREYFPHVGRLRAEANYLDAHAANDVVAMRHIALEAARVRALEGTPSASPYSQTPGIIPPGTPSINLSGRTAKGNNRCSNTPSVDVDPNSPASASISPHTDKNIHIQTQPSATTRAHATLDGFLRSHASEDDAEFEVLMAKQRHAHREKYAWLYEQQAKSDSKLVAVTASQNKTRGVVGAIEAVRDEETEGLGLEGWDYKNKNALMYYPEAHQEKASTLNVVKASQKQVLASNTRLKGNPFKKPNAVNKSNSSLFGGSAIPGSVNILGQVVSQPSPKVHGYGFIATPTPIPGQGDGLGGVGMAGDESPMMTWGKIEDTPFRIETESTPGPQFRMQAEPPREQLRNKISEEMASRTRNRTVHGSTPAHKMKSTPRNKHGGLTPSTPYGNMSPAARLLMNKTISKSLAGSWGKGVSGKGSGSSELSGKGVSARRHVGSYFGDDALRASYSPSLAPIATPKGDRTKGMRKSTTISTGRARGGDTPSLTDGLLKETPISSTRRQS
eukprot:CFRG0022T1